MNINLHKRFLIGTMICITICLTSNTKAANTVESEAETISKCLEDLNSKSVDIRKRAILILGKYSNSLARNAIIRSLKDPDADIRRSALVSLTERSPLPPNSRDSILRLLFLELKESVVVSILIETKFLIEILFLLNNS